MKKHPPIDFENIKLKRAYDPPSKEDGTRILVDRLWPRGIKKADLKIDLWLKDVAPTVDLRKWFAHDPEKWVEFEKKYFDELNQNLEALKPIIESLKTGVITFVYGAHDIKHNHALCLKHFLGKYLNSRNKSF
jgi:uncharacterized protein YeaO (DUF488 family)